MGDARREAVDKLHRQIVEIEADSLQSYNMNMAVWYVCIWDGCWFRGRIRFGAEMYVGLCAGFVLGLDGLGSRVG